MDASRDNLVVQKEVPQNDDGEATEIILHSLEEREESSLHALTEGNAVTRKEEVKQARIGTSTDIAANDVAIQTTDRARAPEKAKRKKRRSRRSHPKPGNKGETAGLSTIASSLATKPQSDVSSLGRNISPEGRTADRNPAEHANRVLSHQTAAISAPVSRSPRISTQHFVEAIPTPMYKHSSPDIIMLEQTTTPTSASSLRKTTDPAFDWPLCLLLQACFVLAISVVCVTFATINSPDEDTSRTVASVCKSPVCAGVIQVLAGLNKTPGACKDFYTAVCGTHNRSEFFGSRTEAIKRAHSRIGWLLRSTRVPKMNRTLEMTLSGAYKACYDLVSNTAELPFIVSVTEVLKNITLKTLRNATRERILDVFFSDLFSITALPGIVWFKPNPESQHYEVGPYLSLRGLVNAKWSSQLVPTLKLVYGCATPPERDLSAIAGLDDVVEQLLKSDDSTGQVNTTVWDFVATYRGDNKSFPHTDALIAKSSDRSTPLTVHKPHTIRKVLKEIANSFVGGSYIHAMISLRTALPYIRQQHNWQGKQIRLKDYSEGAAKLLINTTWSRTFMQYAERNFGSIAAYEEASAILRHVMKELKASITSSTWLTSLGRSVLSDALGTMRQPPPIDQNVITAPFILPNSFLVNAIFYELSFEAQREATSCEVPGALIPESGRSRNRNNPICITRTSIGEPFFFTDAPRVINYGVFATAVANQLLFAAFRKFNDNFTQNPFEERLQCFRNQQRSVTTTNVEDSALPFMILTVASRAVYRSLLRFRSRKNVNTYKATDMIFFVARCLAVCRQEEPTYLMPRDSCNVPVDNDKNFIRAFGCSPADSMVRRGICGTK